MFEKFHVMDFSLWYKRLTTVEDNTSKYPNYQLWNGMGWLCGWT